MNVRKNTNLNQFHLSRFWPKSGVKNFKDYAELIMYYTLQINKIKRLTKTIDTLPDGTNENKRLSQDWWWFVMIELFLLWIVPSYLHPVIMNQQENILWIIWLGVIECFFYFRYTGKNQATAFSLEMETGFAFSKDNVVLKSLTGLFR